VTAWIGAAGIGPAGISDPAPALPVWSTAEAGRIGSAGLDAGGGPGAAGGVGGSAQLDRDSSVATRIDGGGRVGGGSAGSVGGVADTGPRGVGRSSANQSGCPARLS
jgi:hypothetical protein